MRNPRKAPVSTKEFPQRVRGILIQRGSTLAHWARRHGYKVKTVFSAVHGHRHGALSRAIREKLSKELAA